MNEDRILEMFFEKARWQYAIEKGLFKDMNKAVMYQLTTPEARLAMYQRIKSGNYKIMPPRQNVFLRYCELAKTSIYSPVQS